MPRLAKGSPEAKARMAELRARRGQSAHAKRRNFEKMRQKFDKVFNKTNKRLDKKFNRCAKLKLKYDACEAKRTKNYFAPMEGLA